MLATPPEAQYFANWPELAAPYAGAARVVRAARCGDVGFVGGWNSYDYPLWALLRRGDPSARLRHVLVRVVAGSHQWAALDVPEAQREARNSRGAEKRRD